nr:uncharacterized mitochondrial protein AtMg00810-like [Tanacetum cinerariifolium]
MLLIDLLGLTIPVRQRTYIMSRVRMLRVRASSRAGNAMNLGSSKSRFQCHELRATTPSIGFIRPFGCLVTILNTLDSLGKFDEKVDEGFLVGYSNNDGDAAFDEKESDFDEKKPEMEVIVSPSNSAQSRKQDDKTKKDAKGKSPVESFTGYRDLNAKFKDYSDNSINEVNDAGTLVPIVGQISLNNTNTSSAAGPSNAAASPTHGKSLKADFNNLKTSITLSPIPTTRVHKDHPVTQIIGDLSLATQTRSMTRVAKDQVDSSYRKRAIGTKWVFRNKMDERGIVVRNKARLVAQGHTQEEGINYEEVFAPEEVYVCHPLRFEEPDHPNKVYKVVKALYGLHQAPRAWDLCKSFEKLMKDKFQMSSIGELTFFLGLHVKQKKDGIFISQDKYVAEILKKFGLTEGKSASTLIDTKKPLLKDPNGEDVDVHTYRSMNGSLMYLTSSRPNIMFAVCACAHFKVTPKDSYLHAVKRIFRYLKGKPYLGLWYPKDLPFDLVAYSDSDYAGASLDRKSTAEGVNTPRSDKDRHELMELMVFLLPKVEKVGIGVHAIDLQVFAVRHMLLLFSLTNWCCSRSAVSEGFNQIINFLNGSYIKYSLTMNPKIYVSYIKQFWTTVVVKQVNDVTRLQVLVDKKKVVVTKAKIREALCLDDEEGVDCLLNEEIFAELARMGYEKPSTKLTFYKAYVLQSFLLKPVEVESLTSRGDLSTYITKYTSPVNLRRVGKGFSRVKTPLFESMIVEQHVAEEGDIDENVEEVNVGDTAEGDVSAAHREVPTIAKQPSIPSPTPPTPPPQPSQDIPLTYHVQPTPPQSPQVQPPSPQPQPQPQQDAGFLMNLLQEVMYTCLALTRRVEHLEFDKGRMVADVDVNADVVLEDVKEAGDEAKEVAKDGKVLSMKKDETKPAKVQEVVDVVTTAKLITEFVTATSAIITTAKAQVPNVTLTAAPARIIAAPSRRRNGVVIRDPEEESTTSIIIHAKTKSKDKVKIKANENPAMKKYQALKRKPQTEAQARKDMMLYLNNVDGFKMDYIKGMSYNDIRPIFEAKFNSNVAFLLKIKEQIEED